MKLRLLISLITCAAAVAIAADKEIQDEYDSSFSKLLRLSDAKSRDKLDIGAPLWTVSLLKPVGSTNREIVSVDFEYLGCKSTPAGEVHSFKHDATGLLCNWVVKEDGKGHYLRYIYTFGTTKPVAIDSIEVLHVPHFLFQKTGTAPGSPVVRDNWFAAMEYPMAYTKSTEASGDSVAIGKWGKGDLAAGKKTTLRVAVPEGLDEGLNRIQFLYTSGSQRLDIKRVYLKNNGKVIAEDKHVGYTGHLKSGNIYGLVIPKGTRLVKPVVCAEVSAGTNGDSSGNIFIFTPTTDTLLSQGVKIVKNVMPGDELTYSSVIGHARYGSVRRGLLEYIEAERPRPYKPFLHYNSWYDICDQGSDGTFVLDSDKCLEVMEAWHRDFVKPYGINIDSYVFDDGWDDYNNLWSFHKQRFPQGFTPQAELAKKHNTKIGTWFSPFGGYGGTGSKRKATARRAAYRLDRQGIKLSDPRYYNLVYEKSSAMVQKYQVNYFKYDGVGSGSRGDMEAACRLLTQLRALKSDLYINLTTGTWGSPFFLLYGDSIWRGGTDATAWGKGPRTHMWMNYRDGETYKNIVCPAPLFPLNSLMNHGLIFSRVGLGRTSVDKSDRGFADQSYSFFAMGTQLQELYVSHTVMTKEKWGILADAKKWADGNSEVLRDTHWVGGNPYKYEVYGFASYDYSGKQKDLPYKGILCLRNPSDKEQVSSFDLNKVMEYSGGKRTWQISKTVYGEAKIDVDGSMLRAAMPPHTVVVMELNPSKQ